ncbi:aromatic acid exporter family protein [Rufibacter quisquiliarum]|uniref:Uncharacterized membrane protein YgaE (UPF0421/DUF939 family) n=1 Tax=Rufibacter quisquiliarum TaxID=1549639 RepID=A0A839GMQ8_9BACT|nr:uncharacterized membrane protein YgaE (UPF0421/DUF939 family) [Rufibacter quisquiliarum]
MNRYIDILGRWGLTLQIVKTALAASLSWWVATGLLHSQYPYFAAVAAIITVQVTVADSVDKATQRIVGIIGGVLLSMLLGHWFQVGAVSIFLVIFIGMAIAKALKMNPQIISQVAISSLLVLAFGQTNQAYAFERIIETVLGSGMAVLINALIVPQNAVPDVEKSILRFTELSATTLTTLTALLDTTGPRWKTGRSEVDALIKEAEDCRKTLKLGEQSLKYNPLLTHQRVRLSHLTETIVQLERITIQIRGIRRSLVDLRADQVFRRDQPYAQQLHLALEATARCIAAYGQARMQLSPENEKHLAEAILKAQKEQDLCLHTLSSITSLFTLRDMGSILTDLGRIVLETQQQNPELLQADPHSPIT